MAIEIMKQHVGFKIDGIVGASNYREMVRYYMDVKDTRRAVARFEFVSKPGEPSAGAWTRISFLYNNLFDTLATATASSQHRKFKATDIQDRWATRHWRSNAIPYNSALASQWVKGDLGSEQDIKVFVCWWHNLIDGATVKIQANATDAWGSPSVDDSITLYDWVYPIVKFWSTAQSYQWWRLWIDGDWTNIITEGDFDGAQYWLDYARIGRMFLGDYFRPSKNFNNRYSMAGVDESEIIGTIEGQTTANIVPRRQRLLYEFEDLSKADMEKFVEIYETCGQTKPYWIVESEGRWFDRTYYVVNVGELNIAHTAQHDVFSLNWEVEEVG